MCGGSSGGNQTTTQEFKPPDWTKSGWQSFVNDAGAVASKPYVPYDGMQVAPINAYQTQGNNFIEDRALTGAPDINAARGMAMNMSKGNYASPWAGNVSGLAQGYGFNPAMAGVQGMVGQSNPNGSDEATQALMGNVNDQMTAAYMNGTVPQMQAAYAGDEAFGGSTYGSEMAAGQMGLEKQIGNADSQILQQQQQYKGGLWNQDQARNLQALGMYGGMYNTDVGNQLAANQQGAGIYGQDVNAMLQGGALAGNLSQEDWTAGHELQGLGNSYQQQTQKLLDSQKAQWDASQQYPTQMLDLWGNALGRASGSYGSTLASATQPPINPLTALAGAGAVGYGLFGPH